MWPDLLQFLAARQRLSTAHVDQVLACMGRANEDLLIVLYGVVQGILHTKPLVDWFLSHADQRTGKTRKEIKIANRNKLSSAWDSHRKWNDGKLTLAYFELMKEYGTSDDLAGVGAWQRRP